MAYKKGDPVYVKWGSGETVIPRPALYWFTRPWIKTSFVLLFFEGKYELYCGHIAGACPDSEAPALAGARMGKE